MPYTIIAVLVTLFIGIAIGISLAKRRISEPDGRWKVKLAEMEKDYEIKLEKASSNLKQLREENKTAIEKVEHEWEVKYIGDLEELKALFKDSEKAIRSKSVKGSRRVLVGKFIEKFIPFLKTCPYTPADMHFMGQPIDYIVFEGASKNDIKRVVFLEVKTGKSKLSKREKSLKEAVKNRRVNWKMVHVDTTSKQTPDREIESDEEATDVYDKIDEKIESV